jgi:hypothetical protein
VKTGGDFFNFISFIIMLLDQQKLWISGWEWTESRNTPRIRASTVRRKFASLYAKIMNNAPLWTTQYVPFVLKYIEEFESNNSKIPEDVQAVIDILKSQTQSLLWISIDTDKYNQWLAYFSDKWWVMWWYHTYVAKPIREWKMDNLGKRIK